MNWPLVALEKFLCNLLTAPIPGKERRHRMRNWFHPLSPERCIRYIARRYVIGHDFGAESPMKSWEETTKTTKETLQTSGEIAKYPVEEIASTSKENAHSSAGNSLASKPGSPFLPAEKEYIWQCWLQGVEQAPPLVRNCLDSVQRYKLPHQEVVVVTERNFSDYVQLPPAILAKRAAGKIGAAHFSDILRVFLLEQYGGYWIDATCLLTDTFPERIRQESFFMYHSHGEFAYTQIQSCFIRSEAGHYLIRAWRQVLEAYWASEPRLIHYFLLHLMFVALSRHDARFARLYGAMPYVPENPTHVLHGYLMEGRAWDKKLYETAVSQSFLHKLSYKFPEEYLHAAVPTFASVLSQRPISWV